MTAARARRLNQQQSSSALFGVIVGFLAARFQQADHHEEGRQRERQEQQQADTVKLLLREQLQHNLNLQPLVASMVGFDAFLSSDRVEKGASPPSAYPTVLGCLAARQNGGTFQLQLSMREMEHLETRYQVDWAMPIGEGSFGSVFRGIDRITGEVVAVKKISKLQSFDSDSFQHEKNAMMQIRALGGHDNICSLRAHYEQGDHQYLVLEMIEGRELFDFLLQHGAFSEADAARLVQQVASALAFLHDMDIVHGDLKPENLMLSQMNSSSPTIKLVDFGNAQVCKAEDEALEEPEEDQKDERLFPSRRRRRDAANTIAYSSPEFLAALVGQSCEIDPAFDMWALGVTLFVMLTGVHPFDLYGDCSDIEIQEKLVQGEKPPRSLTSHLSPEADHLLARLMESDPSKRMTAQELLEDPWIRAGRAVTMTPVTGGSIWTAFDAPQEKQAAAAASISSSRRRQVVPQGDHQVLALASIAG